MKQLSFTLGDQKIWYRTLDGFEARIAKLGLSDSEAFWGWGFFHRFDCDYELQVSRHLRDLIRCHSLAEIDGVVVCGPCRVPAAQLLDPLSRMAVDLNLPTKNLRVLETFDCVNVIKALEEASGMIEGGCRNVLVLVAERIESEDKRLKKFALFSDVCFSMVVSHDVASCDYEVLGTNIVEDPAPPASNDGILGRTLDARTIGDLLDSLAIDAEDIDQCFYINLYSPISDMKIVDMGFDRRQHNTAMIRGVGHCYGVDPFLSMSQHAVGAQPEEFYVLCASSKEHSGCAVVKKTSKDASVAGNGNG